MQTFMPFDSFALSLNSLDDKRLGKQRVEAYQILNAIDDPSYGWQHHPATNMWRGHRQALIHYGQTACNMWILRGFDDSLLSKFDARKDTSVMHLPPWMGDGDFHLSHRSNLVRKDPGFYGKKFPGVPDNLPYVWPTNGSPS